MNTDSSEIKNLKRKIWMITNFEKEEYRDNYLLRFPEASLFEAEVYAENRALDEITKLDSEIEKLKQAESHKKFMQVLYA